LTTVLVDFVSLECGSTVISRSIVPVVLALSTSIYLQPLQLLPLPLLFLDGVRAKLMLKMCTREKSSDDKGLFGECCRVEFANFRRPNLPWK